MNFLDKMGLRDIFGIRGTSAEIREMREKTAYIERFPGSLAEYNDFKREEHEIIDTERPEKYIEEADMWDRGVAKTLIEKGCVALIRYNLNWGSGAGGAYGGIPVRKKNKTHNN